ncbi:ExeA2 [Desulforapulum autotrophicum HRM2]|uniref:ExeA2 n=1 Tax=Desulforapulum autotrophicum (strain ATCC 43914 / DSM 3382 / VKM B-1955 / HRM2) TaxID=177437 RepID=C0QEQ6_DESAH|nr:AAA family ATPase [Desulforapulum autotrophicum]ACN15398.1 ExeA2 [Desulforapulum autotrophicum HRM2]
MYRSFYNLKLKPFQISSDPAFLWLGEKHKEALATLRYGILDNKGFLLLTGDVGTGKTTLINTLIGSLGDDVICTAVPDPNLEKIDFYNFVASGFGAQSMVKSKGEFLFWLTRFLHTAHDADKKVLLIIDEAQLLTQDLLEEVRLLSNVELAETKLLNIFFVGQNEFNEILAKPINRAVRQRLTLNYNIEALGLEETAGYIEFRLKVAGTEEALFTPGAIREIYAQSQGFPRRINVLCDHALLTGYVQDHRLIDERIIIECARELDIPVPKKHPSPVAPGGIVQSQANASENHQTGANFLKERQKGRSWAYLVFIFIGLLVLAGAMLFSDQIQIFFVRGNHYLTGTKAGAIDHSIAQPATELDATSITRPVPQPIVQDNDILNFDLASQGEDEPVAHAQTDPSLEQATDLFARTSPEPTVEQFLIPPLSNLSEPGFTPSTQLQPLERKVVVRFGYNNNDFTDQALKDLTKFAGSLVAHPGAKVSVKGYTDANGNQTYNIKLSEFRANIVKSFLLGRGARLDQIKTQGMGSENPIATNDTAQGRMMNRRVEIEVISK